MTSNLTQQLIQLEDLIPETNLVATIWQDVETISKRNNLEFQESYDDLDFLVFAILPLSQTNRVALVYHKTHIPHFNFYDMYWSRRLDSLVILPVETR